MIIQPGYALAHRGLMKEVDIQVVSMELSVGLPAPDSFFCVSICCIPHCGQKH
jgi:hypothetical protein